MMLGFGWIHLRTSLMPIAQARSDDELFDIEQAIAHADNRMWREFRFWMGAIEEPQLKWNLVEECRWSGGLLTFTVVRNHRASYVWDMLEWIAQHAQGSYGLYYCHDDEDHRGATRYGRTNTEDYGNVFRVHRILNGKISEHIDPFFGPVIGGVEPDYP